MNERISLFLKGMVMGMAEVIPGVSGGTIAFITGIYETLINTIKAFLGPAVWRSLSSEGLAAAWKVGNVGFLLPLMLGMGTGLVSGVFVISDLLEKYPPLVWAFFFGLIIASAIFVGRQVKQWSLQTVAAIVLAAIVAYLITTVSPAQGPQTAWFVFLSGAIAISALILPGVSGSFILLLLGMYQYVIGSVKSFLETFAFDKLLVIFFFGLGCLVGLGTFSRVLSWMFKHYRDLTLATLTGFMIGSLNKIWPWRKPVLGMTESGEVVSLTPGMEIDKVIKEVNLLPAQYGLEVGESFFWLALVAMLIGFAIVFLLERVGSNNKLEVGV